MTVFERELLLIAANNYYGLLFFFYGFHVNFFTQKGQKEQIIFTKNKKSILLIKYINKQRDIKIS